MSTSKHLLLALTVFCFLASACTPIGTALPATPVAASTATQTPQPIPTLTLTQPPTILPPTPTRTPLPTIPAFGARTILTATPAPKAECPKANPNIHIDFPAFDPSRKEKTDYEGVMLDFLNQGGIIEDLVGAYKTNKDAWYALSGEKPLAVDITNDGIQEIIAVLDSGDLSNTTLHVFTCKNAKYENIFQIKIRMGSSINQLMFKDMNNDGILEIILITQAFWAERAGTLEIYEWNGMNEFQGLINAPYNPANELIYRRNSFPPGNPEDVTYKNEIALWGLKGDAVFEFQDIDKNGIFEVVIHWYHVLYSSGPSRDPVLIIEWDGKSYVIARVKYPPPQFRFQAVQDADDDAQFNEFDKAISLYQDVIFNDKLDWYSRDRQDTYGCCRKITPVPDPSEYPKLAAYAYYRMVILHTHLGEADAAATQYATLQAKFPAASPGHPYAEMASAFWEAHQSSQNMTEACGAAIQYAAEHPDILVVLGSDYHGSQSHTYIPADVCPFR